jgi:hypothetical protein
MQTAISALALCLRGDRPGLHDFHAVEGGNPQIVAKASAKSNNFGA